MRLIDADALIHRFCAERDAVEIEHAVDIGYHNGLNMAASMTINASTIDAVEVVRCGECEYKVELEGHLVCGDSMRAGMGVDVFEIPTYYFDKIAPDDFCSRGRRKDNG